MHTRARTLCYASVVAWQLIQVSGFSSPLSPAVQKSLEFPRWGILTSTSLVSSTDARRRKMVLHVSDEMEEISMDCEDRMDKSIDSVKISLSSIRTGRANAAMLDRIRVNYYGADTPINQMATISVPSAQQLQIDPFDKSVAKDIEKAIMESDLGLTPNNNGSVIRINIPALTEDRRKELLKQCKALGEEGKIALRNIRRAAMDEVKKVEKAGTIGEDEMKDGFDSIQKLTDAHIKAVDDIVAAKEKEVMKV
jgi:ribosome recycling factor